MGAATASLIESRTAERPQKLAAAHTHQHMRQLADPHFSHILIGKFNAVEWPLAQLGPILQSTTARLVQRLHLTVIFLITIAHIQCNIIILSRKGLP